MDGEGCYDYNENVVDDTHADDVFVVVNVDSNTNSYIDTYPNAKDIIDYDKDNNDYDDVFYAL